MSITKRMLSFLLAFAMVISVLPVAGAAKPFEKKQKWEDGDFSDIPAEEWFSQNVADAFELGLMKGAGNKKFNPHGNISLAETITVAARIHSLATTGEENFVQGNPWYSVYAEYALANGIISSIPENITRRATRLEFAEILANAMNDEDLSAINTIDDGIIPDVASNASVYKLYRAGVLTGGDDKGTFSPDSSISRAEVSAIIARMALPETRIKRDLKKEEEKKTDKKHSYGGGGGGGSSSGSKPNQPAKDKVSANIEVDDDGKVKNEVSMSGDKVNATVPAGVSVDEGAKKLTLTVEEMKKSGGNIETGDDETLSSYDVHIDGISAENTVAIKVFLGDILPIGMNIGNITLYHVENEETNAMTQVSTLDELDEHNEFYYDPVTGNVTVALASFSEVAVVAEDEKAWEGNFDYSWYDASKTELIIANADQLAAFGAIVGGMDGQTQDSFAEKTVKLIADVNLGDKESENNPDLIFYPIGYNSSDGKYEKTGEAITSGFYNFEGTFDGNGHTIENFYHNTWEMKGDHNWYDATLQYYRDGMGLFGKVYGGTVKNLTVKNFSSDGEIATTGVIAAYADGATFENIAIFDCNPRVYNIGNGGIVGCVGWYAKETDLKTTFNNITVDNSNKISALWGSYDVACGGIVGQYYPTSGQTSAGTPKNGGIDLVNCHVAAQMDVYNDVCGNYMYYAYRYAGMIIGSIRENTTNDDGKAIPDMTGISATGCTVNYGDWNDYYYCEFEKNGHPSYAGPTEYKFSRVPHSELDFTDSNENGLVDANERSSVTGCKHNHTEVEDNHAIYLPFHQLFTGYGWGVNSIGLEKYSGIVTNLDITEGEQEKSVVKFESKEIDTLYNNKTIAIGELFEKIENTEVDIDGDNVQVTVSPAEDKSTVSGTYTANTTDWTKGTLTFSGTGLATITITDYYFCVPTTITVEVKEREAVEKFESKFTGDFLYRVGNQNAVSLGSLFKAKDGVTIGTVSVTIEALNGTSASGSYTSNATWSNGTIQFSDTGVVKVTIKDDDQYCTPTVLYLEVVDAVNATGATNATANNVVLLNDIGSGFTVSGRYTVYGNGFTLNYTGNGQYLNNGLKQGVVTVSENGTLDNLRIKASIYPAAYMYYGSTLIGDYVQGGPSTVEGDKTRYHYQLSAVVAKGNATISNCYIYGGRTNIFVDTGDVTIKDTILECGTVANAQIQSTSEYTVTFENVTTIQHQVNPTIDDTSRVMLGTGVLVGPDTPTNPTIILNGTFKQYNWVTSEDANAVSDTKITKAIIQSAVNATEYNHTINGKTASNLGIIYMNESPAEVENNTGLPYNLGTVTIESEKGQVYSLQNATTEQIYSDYENANKSTVNGDYMPTFDFDLGDQEISYNGAEDTRYLYGDADGVTALYQDGDDALTLDLSKLATIYKYTGTNYTVTAVCRDSSGNALTATNNVVTLSTQGNYTLEFTVNDNIFYNKNGNTITKSVERMFTVPLTLTVKEASIKNAVVNITKTSLDGVYNTVNLTDYELRIKFLDAISVTDYDNKGTGTTVNLSSNISSATLTPASVNVFTTASTATITYTDGRVLTVNFSKISGSSPGTKTAKVNTSGSVYFTTEGALNNKPTEANSQNKCTITSVSYKGNSGSTVTNDTDVTVTWALDSSGGTPCFTPDTLITLADGSQKRIDELTYEDKILTWDFFKGKYTEQNIILLINHGESLYKVINTKFSDDSILKIVGEHGMFDYDLNKFIYITPENAEEYIGHRFVKANANGGYDIVTLNDAYVTEEYTDAYSITSAYDSNAFAEGMLTLAPPDGFYNWIEMGDTLTYDVEKFNADVEKYGLYTYEDFADYVTYEQFIAFNGAYLKIPVEKGLFTFDYILELIDLYLS